MKQKSQAPAGMSSMFPTGPSIGYGETRTFILTDAQGHSTKLISDVPVKSVPVDEEELPRFLDSAAAYCKSGAESSTLEIMRKKLKANDKSRFDDDGSDWL